MIGKTGPGANGQEELRRALLQRLANRLPIARHYAEEFSPRHLADCCWVAYDVPVQLSNGGNRIEHWVYRLCYEDCPHWHHMIEVWAG